MGLASIHGHALRRRYPSGTIIFSVVHRQCLFVRTFLLLTLRYVHVEYLGRQDEACKGLGIASYPLSNENWRQEL